MSNDDALTAKFRPPNRRMNGDLKMDSKAFSSIRKFARNGWIFLPFAGVFALSSAAYVVYESAQRRKNPVCIDCNRQKEIAEQIYGPGSKSSASRNSARALP